ncbi:16827_t:CDS:10 [Acaulospora morrowiae]|uniref:16827_t:CDS:1 n=1 Tax=Acaulospora morrowiae TaxID=94023 RepID=A0A9N8W325_9GLOM|nr:16827_t:CDS:10 [Acaulospora morrowiae]
MGKNFKLTKKGGNGNRFRGKKSNSKKFSRSSNTNADGSHKKALPYGKVRKIKNNKHEKVEATDNISAQDVFEIDQDEIKEEKRRKNIDELESYEYNVEEKIDIEDDEEIDSDEAFNESDEERFDHFIFRGSTEKNSKKQGLIDLNEEDDYESSADEETEEAEDLHGNEVDEESEDEFTLDKVERKSKDDHLLSDEENNLASLDNTNLFELVDVDQDLDVNFFDDESDEETATLTEGGNEIVDELDDESKVERLDSFIESLDKKRKRVDNQSPIEKRKKKIKERTEAYEESEYNLTTRESASNNKKIDFQDLLGAVQEETGFSGLKQKLASLESGGNKGNYKEPLSAPLPQRIINKLNRQAAYEGTKKDITKWEPIVKHNREAEHLIFPLNPNPQHQPTNNTLAGTFQPSTNLEKEVDSILIESGVKEKDLQQYEELQLHKLSVEEVSSRRKELRMMRELMFQEEIKAKRIAKIKSKAYRKIRKKEKEKNRLKLDELIELDPEAARKEQLKLETARAQERMTLKHKNTSKWAKQILKHGNNDQGSRQAIAEQLQRHEELKRKIHDLSSDEESSDVQSDEYNDDEEDMDSVKKKAIDELAQLEKDREKPPKGIMGMKFMQDAMERDRKKTKGFIDDFIEDLKNLIDAEKRSSNAHSDGQTGIKVSFGHGPEITKVSKSTFDPKSDDEDELVTQSELNNVSTQAKTQDENNSIQKNDSDEENPWLQTDSSKVVTSSKKKNRGIDLKESNKSNKLVSKLKKLKRGRKTDEDDVEIDVDRVLVIGHEKKKVEKLESEKIPDDTTITDRNTVSENEDNSIVMTENFVHTENSMAFTQRELIARAFANDDVIDEFLIEKQTAIDEDKPKEKDITLPGWGAWVGKGVKSQGQSKRILVAPLPGEGVEAKKRQDARLDHVIINEKRIKKAKKYLATDIPHPFETREQYERSIRTPLGREWNTRDIFQKMIMPRVITKIGDVIDPLNAPFQADN